MKDIYYLWEIGRYIGLIWESKRTHDNFYKSIDVLKVTLNMNSSGKYNGQTKTEYHKNYTRVKDIVDKSAGDEVKAKSLSQTQATRITDEWKAINRAMAAKDMGHEHIFEVFFHRAYELGTVTKQDYRDYKLSKLGI